MIRVPPLQWQPLLAPDSALPGERTDPYYWMACAMGFVDHASSRPDRSTRFEVSVELEDAGCRPAIVGLTENAAHASSRYFTGTATAEALVALHEDERVVRVQFAQALLPQRAARRDVDHGAGLQTARPRAAARERDGKGATVLLGLIDNGCPFAHQALLRNGKTRIVRLWDQNPAGPAQAHVAPGGFVYGTEWRRADLHDLMRRATDASGAVDETRCYRLARQTALMHAASHGAHSLGLLAGARLWNGRPLAKRPETALDSAAPTSRSDIVFVQLPQVLMDHVSVAALEQKALDGVRYIYETGKALGYQRIVVSFGYESWVGPHDGSSWFEAALASLVDEARRSKKRRAGIDLKVVMIAGNGKGRSAHVRFEDQTEHGELQLAVPPDNEVPTFVELWVPAGTLAFGIELSPPGCKPLPRVSWGQALAWPGAARAKLAVVMHKSGKSDQKLDRVLIRIAPTRVCDDRQAPAPYGKWTLRLYSPAGSIAGIHAYIGRAEADSHSPHRGRQATFVGRTTKEAQGDSQGTLNGHACGQNVIVAGAYYADWFPYRNSPDRPLHRRSTEYSGAGPTNGIRQRPDVSVAVDDGLVHVGRLAMGTRSGSVWRMTGTSAAAPLWARFIADSAGPRKGPDVPASDDPALGFQFADI